MSSSSFFRRITLGGNYAQYFSRPKEISEFHKQIIWRCNNLGMLELDFIIGKWARTYVPKLNYDECVKFESQVLHRETPDLLKIILGVDKEKYADAESELYLKQIRDWAAEGHVKI